MLPSSSRLRRRNRITAAHQYTGPSAKVRKLVRRRADNTCEWPACGRVGTDYHHRLNRKSGGRHGNRREQINSASWIVLACRAHHEYVTSPHGTAREDVTARGWLLEEHQVAGEVPIRLDGGWVLLDDDGNRLPAEPPEVAS